MRINMFSGIDIEACRGLAAGDKVPEWIALQLSRVPIQRGLEPADVGGRRDQAQVGWLGVSSVSFVTPWAKAQLNV
ncbi:MAG: hypothetical protein DMG65_03825 [Candidatus Angelobacter sp. Gp1-AA117]|nr:MAG: hypothetical protein DMG65_03825 [Candidatus Angelobacter sp. Gp1-AA117]